MDGIRARSENGISRIENCLIENNGRNGVQDTGEFVVTNSTIIDNQEAGIQAFQNGIASVKDCRIESNGIAGILFGMVRSSAARATFLAKIGNEGVTGNEIRYNGAGILFETEVFRIEFEGNDIYDNRFNVENRGLVEVFAPGNYWGESMTRELDQNRSNLSRVWDRRDDSRDGPVSIISWLQSSSLGTDEPAAQFHPADNNPADGRISIGEVTAYGAAWKQGNEWPVEPNPIPIGFLTRAGALWKGGETYIKDPGISAAPLWWVNDQ